MNDYNRRPAFEEAPHFEQLYSRGPSSEFSGAMFESGTSQNLYSSMHQLQGPPPNKLVPPLKGKLTAEQTNAIINARTELYALPDSARVDDVKEFRNTKVIDFTQLDVSDQVNNESIVVLFNDNNNESVVNKGPRPQSSSNGGGPDDMSEETVIPSMNKDPPITLEEALTLV